MIPRQFDEQPRGSPPSTLFEKDCLTKIQTRQVEAWSTKLTTNEGRHHPLQERVSKDNPLVRANSVPGLARPCLVQLIKASHLRLAAFGK